MDGWIAKLVDKNDVTDPYVDVRLGKAKLVKTSVVVNNLNPVWNESYRVEVCHFADHLVFEVKDKVCRFLYNYSRVSIIRPGLIIYKDFEISYVLYL